MAELGTGRESQARSAALVENTKQYLSRLADGGYNVVYSLPIAAQGFGGTQAGSTYTSVQHQVVTKTEITTENCRICRSSSEAPVVLLLATSATRPPPPADVPWHDLWVIHSRTNMTLGTVYLSRDAFFERNLLPLLEGVNKKTTIVPRASGFINDKFVFNVTTLAQDEHSVDEECLWSEDEEHSDRRSLQYVWEDRRELSQKETRSTRKPTQHSIESVLSCKCHLKLARNILRLFSLQAIRSTG